MNLYNKKDDLEKDLKKSIKNTDSKFDLKFDTRIIMYRFLSEIERLSDEKNLSRKELAKKIGTSPSYITQLFRGNKVINLETLAKFQKALNITFDIKANYNDAIDEFINLWK